MKNAVVEKGRIYHMERTRRDLFARCAGLCYKVFALFVASLVFSGLGAAQNLYQNLQMFKTINSQLPGNHILAVAIDQRDKVWVGTDGQGIASFDNETWQVFNTSNSLLPSDRVYAITIDEQNNKWFGTENGLARFNGSEWTIWNANNSELSDDKVRAITIEQDGTFWLGSRARVTQTDFNSWQVYDHTNSALPKEPNYYSILFIVIDNDGNKWMGGDGCSLIMFDGSSWIHYDHTNSILNDHYVISGTKDKNGNLWFATVKGLVRLAGNEWTLFASDNSDLPRDFIPYSITTDSLNAIWAGGMGDRNMNGGLLKVANNHFVFFNLSPKIPSHGINSIVVDSDNIKWFGTDYGLGKLNDNQEIEISTSLENHTYLAGDILEISWTYLVQTRFNLYFSHDNGESWDTIDLDWFPYSMPYKWTVPEIIPLSTKCQIKIADKVDTTAFATSETFICGVQTETPTLNPLPGEYRTPQYIELQSTTKNASIYYTTDGTIPDKTSPQYLSPILVDKNMEIKAIAFKTGYFASDTLSGVYTISPQEMHANIQYSSEWLDSDYDGIETGIVDAHSSSISYGQIRSYIWTMGGDTLAIQPTAEFGLTSGSHQIYLNLISDRGVTQRDSIMITVYSAKLASKGPISGAIAQLDRNRFIASSADQNIYCFDSTATTLWNFSTSGEIAGTVCIKDKWNLLVGARDTRLYSLTHTADPNWDRAMGGTILSSPSADENGNIYFGTQTGKFFSISDNGDINWSMQCSDGIFSSSALSSEDDQIFFATLGGEIKSVSNEGTTLWTYTARDSIYSSPALSPDHTLLIGSDDGKIYKIGYAGDLKWSYQTGGPIKSSPVVDQVGNVFFGSADSTVYALFSTGELLWKFKAASPITGSPTLSSRHLYIGCQDGRMLVLDMKGQKQWEFQTGGAIIAAPLLTADNLLFISSMDSSVYIIKQYEQDIIYPLSSWHTFKGNNQRTGRILFDSTNVESAPSLVRQFRLLPNYPNPFNHSTTLSFWVPIPSGNLSLMIYDIQGKSVRTLASGKFDPGYHTFQWDGKDHHGRLVSSGLYIYRICGKNFDLSQKMLYLK